MSDQVFVSAEQLLKDSIELGLKVMESGFAPSLVVGVWRGGSPVAIAVHELLEYCGRPAEPVVIRATSYTGVDERGTEVAVNGLETLLEVAPRHERVLLVDDVWDTGHSFASILEALRTELGPRLPRDIRTAAPYFKPGKSQVAGAPDYCVHHNDAWLVFPHEMCGLPDEVVAAKPGYAEYINRINSLK